jgi:hypothetical protein
MKSNHRSFDFLRYAPVAQDDRILGGCDCYSKAGSVVGGC